MSVALISHTSIANTVGSGGVGITTPPISTVGASLLVLFSSSYTGTSDSISDSNGNTWTALSSQYTSGGFLIETIYYCSNPTTGAAHTFGNSTHGNYSALAVLAFSGTVSAASVDQQTGANDSASATLSTGSITPGGAGYLVVSGLGYFDNTAGIPTAGFGAVIESQAFVSGSNFGLAVSWGVSSGAIGETWTGPGTPSGLAATIASFPAAPSGGPFTIESGKEAGLIQIQVVPKPVILCALVAVDGDTVYLTTTPTLGGSTRVYNGNTYQAKLQSNPIEQIQALSPQGYDIPGSITLTIADGDFTIWLDHANPHGWRGGTLTVAFVLWDAITGAYSTNAYIWTFILDKPNIDATGMLTVAAQARQSMTRLSVPNFARSNMCGNTFPTTAAQRLDALTNPTSLYWGCGYSPDQPGGIGNTTTPNLLNPDGSALTDSAGIYVSDDYTRSCGAGKATRTQGCMARLGNYSSSAAADGDIEHDTHGNVTGRGTFDTWLAPIGWTGKQYINPSAGTQYGFNAVNPPTGQTHWNQGYGTQWVAATVLEPFSDPNVYSAECIVCMAPVNPANIMMVLVNGVQVTQDNSDQQFTYKVISAGGRSGAVTNVPIMNGQGDPHGSMCKILIGVPVELQTSGSIASVQVLVQFASPMQALAIASATPSGGDTVITFTGANQNLLAIGANVYIQGNSGIPDGAYPCVASTTGPPGTATISGVSASGIGGALFFFPDRPDSAMTSGSVFALNGGYVGLNSAANPVWALMDLLALWGPFTVADFDVQTWYDAAQICAAQITYFDLNGNSATHARYRCSFVLTDQTRQTLAKAVLGLRNCAGIILARNPVNGLLQCYIEETLADQQPAPIAGSNYNVPVSSITAAGVVTNGYLAYLFDGAGSIEQGTFKLGGRTINDTPNTVAFPFQDSANVWVQDSCTTVDPSGYITAGNQEIAAPLQILGIENFDQATRRSNVELAKAMYGNSRFDAAGTELPSFRTTVKAAHLASRVGFICGINYEQLDL